MVDKWLLMKHANANMLSTEIKDQLDLDILVFKNPKNRSQFILTIF